jgi:hypothetical protein
MGFPLFHFSFLTCLLRLREASAKQGRQAGS